MVEHSCTACCFDRKSCEDKMLALKELLEKAISHQRDYTDAQIEAIEKSITVAADVLSTRLDVMNEFRGQLSDQAANFFTRSEHELYKDRVDADVRILRESRAMLEGKASQKSVNFATVMAILAAVVAILNLLLVMLHVKV